MDQRRIARAQETPLVRGGLFSRRRLVGVLALPHGSAAGTTRAATSDHRALTRVLLTIGRLALW